MLLLCVRLYHLLSGASDVIIMDKLLDVRQLVVKIREAGPGLLPVLVVLIPLVLLLDSGLHALKEDNC